jgi:hypothetical protein
MRQSKIPHPRFWIPGALICLCACHQGTGSAPIPPAPVTLCYTLAFAPWEAPDSTAYANSPAGLVAPLPDTIALTPIRLVQRSGPPTYRLARAPEGPEQVGATWSPVTPGVVVLRFPEAAGQGLLVTLRGTGLHLEGRAGIYLDERPSDLIRLTPAANVAATRLPCPPALASQTPGA